MAPALASGASSHPGVGDGRVGVPWEDQVVTVQATFGLHGVGHVAGVPVQAGA